MEKGKIRRLNNLSKELSEMQEIFIQEAENNTLFHIEEYIKHPSSMNGNYVCSDLFKETFSLYTESIDSRKKYSAVIHNSAAVLADYMFHINAEKDDIRRVIFLTGVPGAGKSFLAQSLYLSGELGQDTMIYEGNVATPTIMEKIRLMKNKGKEIYFIVVNPTLELAQRNAINRSFEIGRGASSETMARIISNLPSALSEIYKEFPEAGFAIYKKISNTDIDYSIGWEHLNELNLGSYEVVLAKLLNLRIRILDEIQEDLKKKSEFLKHEMLGEEKDEKRGL